jgi:hypothetical protein
MITPRNVRTNFYKIINNRWKEWTKLMRNSMTAASRERMTTRRGKRHNTELEEIHTE